MKGVRKVKCKAMEQLQLHQDENEETISDYSDIHIVSRLQTYS